jgi:uncharacterized protein (TIGR02231 family)
MFEIESKSKKNYYKLFVDINIKRVLKKNSKISIEYLVYGPSWKPVYDIRLSKNGNAIIEQSAMIKQSSGEDWTNINLKLSNSRVKLQEKPPTISSYTLRWKEVKKVKTKVTGQSVKNKSLLLAKDRGVADSEGAGKTFIVKGKQSVISGRPETKVKLSVGKSKSSFELEFVGSKYNYVYKKVSLVNPFNFVMASGTAYIYQNGEFVNSLLLDSVPSRGKLYINGGVDSSLIVKRQIHNKTKKAGVISNLTGAKTIHIRQYSIKIKNNGPVEKIVRILEQLPISELEDVVVKNEESNPTFKKIVDRPSWYTSILRVNPGTESTAFLKFSVTAPNELGFSLN